MPMNHTTEGIFRSVCARHCLDPQCEGAAQELQAVLDGLHLMGRPPEELYELSQRARVFLTEVKFRGIEGEGTCKKTTSRSARPPSR
jgi:hypothetical protein